MPVDSPSHVCLFCVRRCRCRQGRRQCHGCHQSAFAALRSPLPTRRPPDAGNPRENESMGSRQPWCGAAGRCGTQRARQRWRDGAGHRRCRHWPETLSFGGGVDSIGVTSGAPKVYLVFWGTQWGTEGTNSNGYATFTGDPRNAAPYIQAWIKGLGTNGELWSGVMTQYCDGSQVAVGATSCPSGAPHVGYPSGALAGIWYDNSAASPSQASGKQLAAEAVKAAGHFGNTT